MTQAYIGLGANLGNPVENLQAALKELSAFAQIIAVSSFYKTKPWGKTDQSDFINAVASIETSLSAEDFFERILEIEKKLGRERGERWGPRLIDIDILTFGDAKIDTDKLTVPHPHMFERAFVLIPLIELDPAYVPDLSKLSSQEIAGVKPIANLR